jgi:hypothetical protein
MRNDNFWPIAGRIPNKPMSASAALQSFQNPNSCVSARHKHKGRSSLIVCIVEGRVKFNFTTSYTLSDSFADGQIKSCSLKKLQRKKK